jgi:protein required for attachment to host cells
VSDEDCKPQNPSDDDGRGETEDESNENNRTRVRLQAHALEVEVESQDASFEEVAEFASEQHQEIRRDALIGEYQQLEERNLHSALLGGGE